MDSDLLLESETSLLTSKNTETDTNASKIKIETQKQTDVENGLDNASSDFVLKISDAELKAGESQKICIDLTKHMEDINNFVLVLSSEDVLFDSEHGIGGACTKQCDDLFYRFTDHQVTIVCGKTALDKNDGFSYQKTQKELDKNFLTVYVAAPETLSKDFQDTIKVEKCVFNDNEEFTVSYNTASISAETGKEKTETTTSEHLNPSNSIKSDTLVPDEKNSSLLDILYFCITMAVSAALFVASFRMWKQMNGFSQKTKDAGLDERILMPKISDIQDAMKETDKSINKLKKAMEHRNQL